MGTMDPTFNPVITDDSAAFSQKAVQAMEKERSQMQLDDSYQLLAQMTDYKDSPSCKEKQQCSLAESPCWAHATKAAPRACPVAKAAVTFCPNQTVSMPTHSGRKRSTTAPI